MWVYVQVTIVVSWWSIFGISSRVERGSGIIVYIEIHMIANCDFPQCLNIFIHYNDISVIMNSTLYLVVIYLSLNVKDPPPPGFFVRLFYTKSYCLKVQFLRGLFLSKRLNVPRGNFSDYFMKNNLKPIVSFEISNSRCRVRYEK